MKSADELKNHAILQDIFVQILKQTIECGHFIQQYIQRNFVGKLQVYWRMIVALLMINQRELSLILSPALIVR